MTPQMGYPHIIWMYWENRPFRRKPAYLQLCYESIEKHRGDYELRLLTDKTVGDYIEIPNVVWRFKRIAHRADYIRFQLLHRYGGVWLDADLVLIQDIGNAVDPYIQDYDFIGYGREPGKPSINFMACHKRCPLIAQHILGMEKAIDRRSQNTDDSKLDLVWTEIGHDILWPLAENYRYYHHALEKMAPIFWEDWKYFLEEGHALESYLEKKPFMFMLYNDFMYKKIRGKSRQQLLYSNVLLSKIFRHALLSKKNQ